MSAKILIVEDNEDNLVLLMRRLVLRGYTPIAARNASEARTLVKELPDLVLMDMMLPDDPGWLIADEWKRVPALKNIPVIAVSAIAIRDDIERGLCSALDAYVTKPIDYEELFAKIERLLPQKNEPSAAT